MQSCPHFGEGIHTIMNAQGRNLWARVSGGRGSSVRKLHRGGDVCSGSCRMSRSLSGSYYCLLSWLLRLFSSITGGP